MHFEALREAIRNLTPEDRARLMSELGPELCGSIMGNPRLMEQMMPRCEEMMKDPELQQAMRSMMERMMRWMMSGGKPNA